MDYGVANSNIASETNYYDLSGLQTIKQEKDDELALKKVAKQFESLFMHEILKSMRKANEVFEEGGVFSSSESKMFRDMYDQQLSVELSAKGGLGIADLLFRQLSGIHGQPVEQQPIRSETSPLTLLRKQHLLPKSESASAVPSLVSSDDKATTTASTEVKGAKVEFSDAADFVAKLLPMAEKVAKSLPLNPMIFIAQAAVETGWGKHILQAGDGRSSHNLFNIKADSRWSGPAIAKNVLEYRDGIAAKEKSQFRQYTDFEQSFTDYFEFLTSNPRYQPALQANLSEQQFVTALQQSGYATDPDYANNVFSVYKRIVSTYETENTLVGER